MLNRYRSGSMLLACVLAAAVAAGVVLAREPAAAAQARWRPAGPTARRGSHLPPSSRQLTFGGHRTPEAYFSPRGDGTIHLPSRRGEGVALDQIFRMDLDGSNQQMVSTGGGRTTCGYFYPGGDAIVYASTHLGGEECPPPPSFRMGYVWAIYDTYDIFRAAPDGSNLTRLTDQPGYDAEPTIGPDGRIVFTSVRDGDMEIYSMNGDGTDVRRLTHRRGRRGGVHSPDGSQIIFRGREIPDGPEYDDYKRLLDAGLWRPTAVEVFVMDADGGNVRQVPTGGASFARTAPRRRALIFSSNMHTGPPD